MTSDPKPWRTEITNYTLCVNLHTVCEILCSLLTKSSHLKIFTLTPSLASLTNIMHGTKSPFCWKKSPWVQWEEIILASSISPTLFRSHLVTSFTNLQWVNVSILSSPEDRWNGVLDFAQTYSRSKLGEDKQESLVQLQQAGSQRCLVQTFSQYILSPQDDLHPKEFCNTSNHLKHLVLPSLAITGTFSDIKWMEYKKAMGGFSITVGWALSNASIWEENFMMLGWKGWGGWRGKGGDCYANAICSSSTHCSTGIHKHDVDDDY